MTDTLIKSIVGEDRHYKKALGFIITAAFWALPVTVPAQQANPVIRSEFLFTSAPFASAHASTIVESDSGLVAAWFGGTREGASDVGVWLARESHGAWSAPVQVADGVQPDGTRFPCYNPVLFQQAPSVLRLYYKVGPNPAGWWGMVRTSHDGGRTWSGAERLPVGILGPIKNKPVQLKNGTVVAPSSTEQPNGGAWDIHFELTADSGRTWTTALSAQAIGVPHSDAIQPTILFHGDGSLQALVRTRWQVVGQSWSRDNGKSWTAVVGTSLKNPNSGIDAVTLRDGRQLIVYNNSTTERTPLVVGISADGEQWYNLLTLENEPGEYSYPAVIQSRDGLIHITYTWRRERIKHVVIDPTVLGR